MTDDVKFVEEVSEAFKSGRLKWNAFTMAKLIDLAARAANPQAIIDMGERIKRAEGKLLEIGVFAHDKSTGPAIPDEYWSIRDMAYSVFENSDERKVRIKREVAGELDSSARAALQPKEKAKP